MCLRWVPPGGRSAAVWVLNSTIVYVACLAFLTAVLPLRLAPLDHTRVRRSNRGGEGQGRWHPAHGLGAITIHSCNSLGVSGMPCALRISCNTHRGIRFTSCMYIKCFRVQCTVYTVRTPPLRHLGLPLGSLGAKWEFAVYFPTPQSSPDLK